MHSCDLIRRTRIEAEDYAKIFQSESVWLYLT
jgi:hypothetical protein